MRTSQFLGTIIVMITKHKCVAHLKVAILLLVTHAWLYCGTSDAHEIKLSADYWCPYSCEPNSSEPGTMVEIARVVFSAEKIDVSYSLLPWSRAIKAARAGEINAIVGATHGDAPDFVFPEQAQALSGDVIVSRATDSWQFTGWESMQGRKLAAVKDYDYTAETMDFLNKTSEQDLVMLVGGENPLDKLFPMLMTQRFDSFVENQEVVRHFLNKRQMFDRAKISQPFGQTYLYIAFSPELTNSKRFAHSLSVGMGRLRENGQLAEILSRYGLKDWIANPAKGY